MRCEACGAERGSAADECKVCAITDMLMQVLNKYDLDTYTPTQAYNAFREIVHRHIKH
jgi:hypothetical protein